MPQMAPELIIVLVLVISSSALASSLRWVALSASRSRSSAEQRGSEEKGQAG